ncbi:MAG: hypothetical protein C0506_04595 [Anaerolinea sp.]|nr:hypothetical protein [Anaerolinea sp.]
MTTPTLPAGPARRDVVRAFAFAGSGAALALAMLVALQVIFVRLSWPHVEPLGDPEFGINFSCNHAEYLLLEDPAKGAEGYVDDTRPGRAEWCAETLGTLLRGLGAKHVRLSVEWDQVEPRPGEFDFRLIDALLAEAGRSGATALVSVGAKAQRHPEFFIPEWALAGTDLSANAVVDEDPLLRSRILAMIGAVVAHVAASPAIDSWSADNEPYIPSERADGWRLSREFARLERETILANDPRRRPVSINHAQHFVTDRRWRDALEDADILAASFYPFRNVRILGRTYVIAIPEIGFMAPNYAHQARSARAQGKPFWLTEMQAEPWVDSDIRLVGPASPSPNLTPDNFRKAMDYARRTGAERVYLWGSEWWLFQKERYNDPTWWDLARETISSAGASER